VVFPGRFPLLCCCSACVLGCSHYFMTSLALFSLSRPPHSPSPSPSPSSSLSPSPRPPHHLLSRPLDIIPFHRALPSASLSPPGDSRLAPNNTRFGHKSGTCPPQSALDHRLPLHVPSAPPNRLFHWKRSRPVATPLPDLSFSLPPFSASPQVRRPPTLHQNVQYSGTYIQYT
jgi:hypothetical protein